MKYPCGLIQDLLPLYHDEVCSRESRQAVRWHLEECRECRAFYEKMQQAENVAVPTDDGRAENRKAEAFHTVKKKLRRRQMLLVFFTALLILAGIFAAIGAMKKSVRVIMSEENISATMTDEGLAAKLRGSRANYVKIKRVDTSFDGQGKVYLFFCMSASKWDDMITGDDMFSVYTLCPQDKGAQDIDCVYYYTGDYTDIETMRESRPEQVIENSLLLWSK